MQKIKVQKRKTNFGSFLFSERKNFSERKLPGLSKVKNFFDLMENSTFFPRPEKSSRTPGTFVLLDGAGLGRAWDSIMHRYANIQQKCSTHRCSNIAPAPAAGQRVTGDGPQACRVKPLLYWPPGDDSPRRRAGWPA